MKKVLVTGASGQLGQCLKKIAKDFPELQITFASSADLDLSQFAVVGAYFRQHDFDYCINCAAYTNVEKAEKEQEMAYLTNAEAVKNLASDCRENDCTLIHVSTDYVFDGKKASPYLEEDETAPLNVYGASKLLGEKHISQKLEQHFIVRTSWLYSDICKNFFNTIKEKIVAGEELSITTSQTGTPTNAYDLAEFLLRIVTQENGQYGIYHYSNSGEGTWYDFSKEIISNLKADVVLTESNEYKTLATRPEYSVLSKKKVLSTFDVEVLPWKDSLKKLF